MRRTEIKRRTISIPALNLNYYGGIIESIDIYGIRYTRDLDLDVLRIKIDDLKEENADLLEQLQDAEHEESVAWDKVRGVERQNDELRKLLVDFRNAMWSAGEWTEPFDVRMCELGVEL